MKVAWILLLSLVLVFLLEDCDAWRRRIRIRARRFTRKVLPRIRGRRLLRKIGHVVKKTFKTIAKVAVLTSPSLFVSKQVYDRFKAKRLTAALRGQTCIADIVCGGSWLNDRCTWFCDNICKVFANDTLNWPGELVTLPCKFSEYDYTRSGYFYPADLAYHVGERGQESDNLMVFKYLDQNGDGKVSLQEFSQTSKYLLTDQELCKSTKEV